MAIIYAQCVQGELFEKPLSGVKVWCQPKFHWQPYVAVTDRSGHAEIVAPLVPLWLSEPVYAEREDLKAQTAIAYGDIFKHKYVWKAPEREGDKATKGEEFTALGLLYDLFGEPDLKLILLGLVFLIGFAVLAWGIRPYAKIAAKVT